MDDSKAELQPAKSKSLRLGVPFLIATIFILVTGAALWLGGPVNMGVPTTGLSVTGVRLASNGGVVFGLSNSGQTNVSITTVQGFTGSVANITSLGSVYLSSNNKVSAGQTRSISVQFQNVGWQSGVRYDFILISSVGNKYPAYTVG